MMVAQRQRNSLGQRIRFTEGANAGKRMKDDPCCCGADACVTPEDTEVILTARLSGCPAHPLPCSIYDVSMVTAAWNATFSRWQYTESFGGPACGASLGSNDWLVWITCIGESTFTIVVHYFIGPPPTPFFSGTFDQPASGTFILNNNANPDAFEECLGDFCEVRIQDIP